MRHQLADTYGPYFCDEYAGLLSEAEAILQDCFGNSLWKSANSSLFSGVSNILEEALIYYLALQLTNNENMAGWLDSLIRWLPRAIPLGWHGDRADTKVVLVA